MDTRTLLSDRIATGELCPGAQTLEAWLDASWARFRFGKHSVPLIPLWGLKKALAAHDVHHLLLDYPTTMRGELAIATWELFSGGCAWNLPFWLDRTLGLLIGLALQPQVTVRAARRGWGQRNLYGMPTDALLASDVDSLRRRMRLKAAVGSCSGHQTRQ